MVGSKDGREEMSGLGPRRNRYAGAAFNLFETQKRFKKGGGSSAPPAIDPFALGAAQTASNLETARAQSRLSNVNTYSPLGQTVFTPGANDQWNLSQNLTPQLGNLLNSQQNLATSATDTANRVAQNLTEPAYAGIRLLNAGINNLTPEVVNSPRPNLQPSIDFGSLGTLPSSANGGYAAPIRDAQNAAYDTQAGFLNPQFANKRADQRQQLADEGIPVGSEAYSRAQGDLGRQETLAYRQAMDTAVQAGQAQQARLFGEDLSGRQQGAQELATGANFRNATAQQGWQDPLTALASIAGTGSGLYGSVAQDLTNMSPLSNFAWAGSLPTFGGSPTAVAPANIVGAGQVGANSAANRFAAGNTLNNQLFNSIGSLGGALGNALGLGNGGLGNLLGLGGSGGLFGGGGAAAADAGALAGDAAATLGFWIVCTELMRQGKMPKRHWIVGAPVFAAYPEDVKRGYYLWAIPTVRHLRRHPGSLFSRTVGAVFRWRAENIAAHKGIASARKLWRGAAVTAVLYPICKTLGRFVGEQDWRSVYRGGRANG